MAISTTVNSTGLVYNGASIVRIGATTTYAVKHGSIKNENSTSVIATINGRLDDRFDDPNYYG